MLPSQVRVQLEITTSRDAVYALLTYTNTSSTDAYVEKINGCLGGKIGNNVFRITTVEGQKVKYTGILVRRPPPGPDDFVKIPPGEKLSTRVRLDELYAFLPGPHTYKATYRAFHSRPDGSGLSELKSNEVTFSLSK